MPEWIHTLTIAWSGAYRGGATGIGIVVQERGPTGRRGPVTRQVSEAHPSVPAGDTNSFAVLRALEFALEQGYSRVQLRSSANAFRKGIRRDHRAQQSVEEPIRARVLELARRFAWVDFRYVARRKNQTARKLARDAWETVRSNVEPARSDQRYSYDEFRDATDDGEDIFCEDVEDAPDSIPF